MQDSETLNTEQMHIHDKVEEIYLNNKDNGTTEQIDATKVGEYINKLKGNRSPRIDGVTTEHLRFGKSEPLCHHLANLYSTVISHSIVPTVFTTGIIIPIIKKSTLNPNQSESYRPVTLSSVHTKLIEYLMLPKDNVADTQFGFRQGRGTSMACSLLNDTLCYSKGNDTPIYLCAMDAEKCFDKIWHSGLLYKLWGMIPNNHWLLLYRWYKSCGAIVRWNGGCSSRFSITRGVRQGSVLSPLLFNIFINDMLIELKGQEHGIMIGKEKINAMGYADDITVLGPTVTGLQCLINVCSHYAKTWRFSFGIKKSKCMIYGPCPFQVQPKWFMGNQPLETVNQLDILGINYASDGKSNLHVDNRIKKCRNCFYGLRESGMSYPGLASEAKSHIWKTVLRPCLFYGCETIELSNRNVSSLETLQSNLIKSVHGLGARSHHSKLLQALNIPTISEVVKQNVMSLFNILFKIEKTEFVFYDTLSYKWYFI